LFVPMTMTHGAGDALQAGVERVREGERAARRGPGKLLAKLKRLLGRVAPYTNVYSSRVHIEYR
jgi:hypothetical protein